MIEGAIAKGWEFLELEVPTLQEQGSISMRFIVFAQEKLIVVDMPEPQLINDADAKTQVFARVRELCEREHADTVFIVSDAWVSTVSSKDKATVARVRKIGIEKAHELGLLVKSEALTCKVMVRGSLEEVGLTWHYHRDSNNKITMGEREVRRGEFQGRMSNFFPPQKVGHA